MSRDWQKDMELLNQCGDSYMPYKETEFSAMLPYWLQQYAAEKERADKLEMSLEATEGLTRAETKRADGWREHVRKLNIWLEYAEAREQKLREAIEEALRDATKWENPYEGYNDLQKLLDSLYQKEGETK
jgi:hypothetical protein